MRRSKSRNAAWLRIPAAGLFLVVDFALAPARAADQPPASPSAGSQGTPIQEIVVTAQKRQERLQDVPVPVTALTSETLISQNQVRAQDFFSSVPGLNLQTINSRSNLAIRGITTGPGTGNPVVGYTIDDVPYGSSAGLAGLFGTAPDIDPSELARIEVLRGPQGTLYGAASIGGLVKYVTVDPSTTKLGGSVAAGTEAIRGELGYNVRGAINIPLTQTLAVRASAFTREDPGYIDNVTTGARDVNRTRVSGGRLSALWRPSSTFSIKFGALYQTRAIYGTNDVDIELGSRYRQSNTFNTGHSGSTNQLYSAIMKLDVGRAEIASLSSYQKNTNFDHLDTTASGLNLALPSIYPVGIDPFATTLEQDYRTKKFTQEVRVTSPVGDHVNWIVGAFYTHESTPYTLIADATDPANGTVYGVPILWHDNIAFSEYAAFTDVTVSLTDRFDVQVGGRYSENHQALHHRQWTVFDPPGTDGVFSNPVSSGHAFTYLVTPRFKISRDHMVYARIASGYRPGGPNALCDNITIPCQYAPDKTVNYEIGAKGNLFDRALSYDISAYYIDWKNLQVTEIVPGGANNFNANASHARSQGVEASFEARPLRGMTLTAWGAYTDAVLLEGFSDLVAVYGAKGDRLPYSSRYSGRISINQTFPISSDMTGFVEGSISYVGERRGEFVSSAADAPLRQRYPAYAQGDVSAGMQTGGWRLNAFVQNVTNTRGLTGGGYNNQTNLNQYWVNYTQPRTIGAAITRTF